MFPVSSNVNSARGANATTPSHPVAYDLRPRKPFLSCRSLQRLEFEPGLQSEHPAGDFAAVVRGGEDSIDGRLRFFRRVGQVDFVPHFQEFPVRQKHTAPLLFKNLPEFYVANRIFVSD